MQRRHEARRTAHTLGRVLGTATLIGLTGFGLSGCAMLQGMFEGRPSTPYETGATEFQSGDALVIERLYLEGEEFAPGATIHVEGRYELGSREAATLYLGTTAIRAREASFEEDELNRQALRAGSGSFALNHRIPAQGYPHLTLYDAETGAPFGGIYFGRGDSVLHERKWSYDN